MVKLYRDHAVVLRTHPLGEADRIITLLTRGHGKVRAVAKGVRKTGSRFGARLEPFGLVDIQLHRGRNLDTVTQVVTIESFAESVTSDYARLTAASAMLETVDRLTDDTVEPSGRGFLLLVGAMRAIAAGRIPPDLVLDSFLIRMLALAGWAPELRVCASCGADGPHHAFDVSAGGLVCTACRRPGAVAVRQVAVEHLIFLLAGDWEHVLEADAPVALEASRLIADTITWHLERSVRSFGYVERGTPGTGNVEHSELER
jgi:DNA repair protein RecO (recombination protein O)